MTGGRDPLMRGGQDLLLTDGRDLLMEGGQDPHLTRAPDPTEMILMTEEKGLLSVIKSPEAEMTTGVFLLYPRPHQVNTHSPFQPT